MKRHPGRMARETQTSRTVSLYTKDLDLWTRVRVIAAHEVKPLAHLVEELIAEALRKREKPCG